MIKHDPKEVSAWQPIETAPKDGGVVLCTGHAGVRIVESMLYHAADDGEDNGVWGWAEGDAPIRQPTHWMPLPAPPSATAEVQPWPQIVEMCNWPADAKFQLGDKVTTPRAPFWNGTICGWYQSSAGHLGFAVEADAIPGAIHVYPDRGLVAIAEAQP